MKKTLLIITVCEQNKERIGNQLANLNKHTEYLAKFNIEPIFVCGNKPISVNTNPYVTWNLDVEESCVGLYKKIFASFQKALEQEFDYLIKMDDDTLFNINLFDTIELDADYIGRQHKGFSENNIILNLPMYNINNTIVLYPGFFSGDVTFATGDFYILSKKVVQYLVEVKEELFKLCSSQEEYVLEDQLVGYAIRDKTDTFTFKDISYITSKTDKLVLQATKNLVSLHPISNTSFMSLLEKTPKEQLQTLTTSPSLAYRKILIDKLKNDIKKVILDFVNSKKLSGMG